jgi:hypothetical protein
MKITRTKLSKFFDKFDIYGADPPGFNIDGRNKIGTSIGFTCTVLTLIIMLLFSSIKIG